MSWQRSNVKSHSRNKRSCVGCSIPIRRFDGRCCGTSRVSPSQQVAVERSRVAVEGWGARLLGLQHDDGNWGGGPWVRASWASTMETLMLLRELGLDPASAPARNAIARFATTATGGRITAMRRSSKASPSRASTAGCSRAARISARRATGSSIGFSASSCPTAAGTATRRRARSRLSTRPSAYSKDYSSTRRRTVQPTTVKEARLRGQEYLLERKLFRSLTDRKVIDRDRKNQRRLERSLVSDAVALRHPVGAGLSAKSAARPDDASRRGDRPGDRQAEPERSMAARSPSRRHGAFHHGGDRHDEPLE